MSTIFTEAQKSNIANQYWNGVSVKDLCAKYQVPRSSLYTWLKPYQNVYKAQRSLIIHRY